MKVLVLTLKQWNTFNTWLVGKGLKWFKTLPDGRVDPRSTSRTVGGKYVLNLSKMEGIKKLRNTTAWKNHKEQIKARIFNLEDIEIDREID